MRHKPRLRAVLGPRGILAALAAGVITLCGFAEASRPKQVDLAMRGEKFLVEAPTADLNRFPVNVFSIRNTDVVLLVDDRGKTTRIDKSTTVEQLREALKEARVVRIQVENPEMQKSLVEFIYPTYLKYGGATKKGKDKEPSLDRVVIVIPGGSSFLIQAE